MKKCGNKLDDSFSYCNLCGNKINISINSHIYFPKTCSNKCSKQLTNIKSKETKLKLYNNQSYNNSNKRFNTCIEKYGSYSAYLVVRYFQSGNG